MSATTRHDPNTRNDPNTRRDPKTRRDRFAPGPRWAGPLVLLGLMLPTCGPGGGAGAPEGDAAFPDGVAAEEAVARTEIERGPIKVTVELAPKKARLSDEPTLTLRIDSELGVDVEKPPFGEAIGDFLIRDFQEPLPRAEGTRQIIEQVYTLEPTRTGELSIHPITVTFVDNRSDGDGKEHRIETEGLQMEIASVVGTELPSLTELRPAAPPVALPETTSLLWLWIGGPTALLLAVVLVLVLRRKRRTPVPLEEKLTPSERAWLELQELIESDLVETDVKLFYVELTGIVRRFIERDRGIHAPEQTTEEFLVEIGRSDVFSGDVRRRLKSFLEAADLVKFAAVRPGKTEIEESFERAKAFIGIGIGDGDGRTTPTSPAPEGAAA